MKATLKHSQINVSDPKKSFPFYKELLEYFGYKVIYEDETIFGIGNKEHSLWFVKTDKKFFKHNYHRDRTGLNHLGFGVDKKEDVDKFYEEFMKPRNIKPEFETPRERPEFGEYYQIMFLDPDGIGLEVVYHKE